MTQFRSIVVATDFSAGAALAAARAARLCRLPGVETVQLLHVVDAPWLGVLGRSLGMAESAREALMEEAAHALAAQVQALAREAGRSVTSRVMVGPLLDTLLEGAAGADLLVIGAHGQHPVRAMALGSTGERMLRRRRGAMLVVRKAAGGDYRQVLAPVDFSPYGASVVRSAAAIAPQARIEVLHAFEVPFEGKLRAAGVPDDEIVRLRQQARVQAVDGIAEVIAHSGVEHARLERRIGHGYAPRAIVDAARESGADLVVIGKHGESRTEDLLLGSVTLHILGEVRCDVLVVGSS